MASEEYEYERDLKRSHTVWNKEIFAGFMDLLHDIFDNGLPVVVKKPDEDFKVESYPCVILQATNYKFSVDRWYKYDEYMVARDTENFLGVVDKTPLPFDISVQMDFYSKSQEILEDMTVAWLFRFRRDLLLHVRCRGWEREGDSDFEDDVLVLQEGEAKRMDEVQYSDRLFRACYNFNVHGKIEEHDLREEVPLLRKARVTTQLFTERKLYHEIFGTGNLRTNANVLRSKKGKRR